MNKLFALLSGLLVLPSALPGAETAQARLFCLSLRFQQGTDSTGFQDLTLDLSTIALETPNGELRPNFPRPDYVSGFHMFNSTIEETIEDGVINLNLPDPTDSNTNGFPDFFEVSQAASGVSTGTYASPPVDSGTIQATWNRAAGSKTGACVLTFRNALGPLAVFTHSFDLIEFTGPLNYTPAATNLAGTVSLTQSGDASSQLSGTVLFVKSATNRFNDLELQPGVWTNSASQTLAYTNDFFERDLNMPTNYFGFVDFDDGDPNTPDPDYLTWLLSIDDANDSNGNGVPDFSDDAGSTNARAPSLTLTLGSTNLLLTISGTVGRNHEVQQIGSLSQTNWTSFSTITLTSDPQTVPLPFPTNAPRFWRVRVL